MTAKEYGVLIPKESGTDFYFYYGRNTQSEEGSLSDLPSGYIWLAAHKPEHINSGIEIRSNGWLIKTMEMLVAEMGYRLPEHAELLLQTVYRLTDWLEKRCGRTFLQPYPLAMQAAQSITLPNFNLSDAFLQTLKLGGHHPGKMPSIDLPEGADGKPGQVISLTANMVDLARFVKSIALPMGDWLRTESKNLEDNPLPFYGRFQMTLRSDDGIAHAAALFLRKKHLPESDCIWLNETEYRFFVRYLQLECLDLYICNGCDTGLLQQLLPFSELDRLSYTRCLAAQTMLEALLLKAEEKNTVNPTSYWLRSAIAVHYFNLAATMGETGFLPDRISPKSGVLRFGCNGDRLSSLVQAGFAVGLEPPLQRFSKI